MYVRDAKNREEVWLLDHIEEMDLDDASFRSRDYVVAVDEETGEKGGFGRFRVHKLESGEFCEITGIGVLPEWRSQGVGAHVVERLVEYARDEGFEDVYSFTETVDYLQQFGFQPVPTEELPEHVRERLEAARESQPDAVALTVDVDAFEVPDELRRRFKRAGPEEVDQEPEETAEDFGIDPDEATYKYDI